MIETAWVNLRVIGNVAEYVNISGYCGNGYANEHSDQAYRQNQNNIFDGFEGLAAVSVDEYRCSNIDCQSVKYQLRIEGLIPGAKKENRLQNCELHVYARSSMNAPSDSNGREFVPLTAWSGKLVGVISGKSVEVRHTPPPPGYPNNIRRGQTMNTWAMPGPELVCNVIDEFPCPYCKKRAEELLPHSKSVKEILSMVRDYDDISDEEE